MTRSRLWRTTQHATVGADDFDTVKSEFEDPGSAVRLLLATDAASEGINMQEWPPSYRVCPLRR